MRNLTAQQALRLVKELGIEAELIATDPKLQEAAVNKVGAIRDQVADAELDAFDDELGRWVKDLQAAATRALAGV